MSSMWPLSISYLHQNPRASTGVPKANPQNCLWCGSSADCGWIPITELQFRHFKHTLKHTQIINQRKARTLHVKVCQHYHAHTHRHARALQMLRVHLINDILFCSSSSYFHEHLLVLFTVSWLCCCTAQSDGEAVPLLVVTFSSPSCDKQQ